MQTEPTPTPDYSSPSLMRRLTAMIYDSLLVIAVVAVANGIALGVQVAVLGSEEHALHPQLAQIVTIGSIFGFFTIFWLKQGQTLGMQAWRIKLVSIDGQPLTVGRALRRCLAACLSAGCLGLGYLWCLVDRNRRYWHDYLSGTELLLLPKESRDR